MKKAPVRIVPIFLYDEFETGKTTNGGPIIACCKEEKLLFCFKRHCSDLYISAPFKLEHPRRM